MWSALVIFDYNLLQSSDDFCTWGLGRLNKVVQFPRIFWEVVQLQSLRSAHGIRLAHGKLANHLFLVHIDPLLFGRPETSVQHRGLRQTEMRQVESWSSHQCWINANLSPDHLVIALPYCHLELGFPRWSVQLSGYQAGFRNSHTLQIKWNPNTRQLYLKNLFHCSYLSSML